MAMSAADRPRNQIIRLVGIKFSVQIASILTLILAKPAYSQGINCIGFAQYLQNTAGMYSTHDDFDMLQGYFKKDFRNDTPEQIQNLSNWIHSCEDYFNSAVQNGGSNIPLQNQMANLKRAIETGLHYIDNVQQSIEQKNLQEQREVQAADRNRENNKEIEDIPACNDARTVSTLKMTVESSGQTIIGLKGFFDVSTGDVFGSRVCDADALFKSGEHQIQYSVKWFDKEQGQLAVAIRQVD